MDLQLIYFSKFKQYWLVKKLEKMQLIVAAKFHNHRLKRKSIDSLIITIKSKRQIEMACDVLKSNNYSLAEYLDASPLAPKITKVIYAVNHYRLSLMRKNLRSFQENLSKNKEKN